MRFGILAQLKKKLNNIVAAANAIRMDVDAGYSNDYACRESKHT